LNISKITTKFIRTTANAPLARLDRSLPKCGEALETFESQNGEKLFMKYSNGVLVESKKLNPDDSVAFVKKYSIDENGKKIVETLNKDENGILSIVKTFCKTNETIEHYLGSNGFITKYLRKFGNEWKPLETFVTPEKQRVRPESLYLIAGREINMFLRNGEFYNSEFRGGKFPQVLDNIPEVIRPAIEYKVQQSKELNREILDGISIIDKQTHTSHTESPMIVYRDAPISWLESADKNGRLVDKGFCSTSTEAGASLEGLLGPEPKMTYEIELDKGVPFWDLTYTSEKEMLLPRDCEFQHLGGNKLKLTAFRL
jgi:hypothetical protein